MTDKTIAAPLAAALAAKGYASLTSVQQAVLESDAEGRDMLVSAQTGSGKTVAFGLAIAPQLLDGDILPDTDVPLGLAIAPTRELALQVAAELTWLYAQAGARIATCVGGMDYRSERRALERGAHIVVGTPGRLRDHIERGSLDLSGLRVAVLDEADEMLDLGFREDLEFILQSAPEDRRTLMFSATVPPAIEQLAGTFQRDAKRIMAQGESRQHGDIEYRAFNVAARDREPAIFNILRLHEARTAIIFCKTRANVNHLLARMGNRGFKAVALSGELSQQERTHALQALRDGRAQVCVATDVAARGIDLPGLELVIHADLPTNSETLLHRSGRTGRAGAKGVSALIVMPSEIRKAQMLLKRARVEAEWGPAPSADEVRVQDDTRMLDHPALRDGSEDDGDMARTLLDRFGPDRLAQAFIRMWREGRPAPEELTVLTDRAPAAARERPPFGEAVWFSLSVGHSGRAEARWLLPKICDGGGINRDAIGAIRVREHETFVQIAVAQAGNFGKAMELEPDLMMRRLEGEPNLDRPAPRATDTRPARRKPEGDWQKPARTDDAETAVAKPRKARWTPEDRAAKGAKPSRPAFDKPGGSRSGAPKPAGARDRGAKFAAPRKGGKPRKGDY
ncbi:DEAD/DEAH box helicase [Paracoccus aerius]|uniref:DEAD/DEAH box helicase n=1 Tax=Paracoccus aerius TaxID=1915382 RepID=A0ABS1S4P2_9RHOB|nr:DEAD/DEAH box helicase [Paracoccus aerius]MBL3673693.1 DEAD/DEAH box helicase [Paracoccus aerius]GHG22669.1 DEAD/DEAH box helicase [Paracoccus aerius]